MSEELKKLNVRRGAIKRQINAFSTFLEDENVDILLLKERYEKFSDIWKLFEELSVETEYQILEKNDDRAHHDHIKDFAAYEEIYYKNRTNARSKLELRIAVENSTIKQDDFRCSSNFKIKLPPLIISPFSGDYDQWLSFKDSYVKAVHQQEDIPDVQKFQILKSLLKGDALKIISALEATDNNYKEAWKLLQNRFSNERVIINSHLKSLFEIPGMTKSNQTSLRGLVDSTRTHLRSLKSLGEPTDSWDTVVIYLLLNKLDKASREDWERELSFTEVEDSYEQGKKPTLENFLKFLEKRCMMLEMTDCTKINQNDFATVNNKRDKRFSLTSAHLNSTGNQNKECQYCSEQHALYKCDKFLKLPVEKRFQEVIKLKLCTNCLKLGHFYRDCKATTCKKCNLRHNTLLHREKVKVNSQSLSLTQDTSEAKRNQDQSVVNHCMRETTRILLSTAQVYVSDKNGKQHLCRALLDPGSQINLITEEFARALQIKPKPVKLPVSGVNQSKIKVQRSVQLTVKSTFSRFTTQQEFFLIPQITQHIPQIRLDKQRINFPPGIELADPTFDTPGAIDMLIGAGIFWKILNKGENISSKGQPTFQGTSLGWIIGGELNMTDISTSTIYSSCNLVTTQDLNQQIEQFWKLEEVQNSREKYNLEEFCEVHFTRTHKRMFDGRFEVELPRSDQVTLGGSFDQAMRRLQQIERRFQRNSDLKDAYIQFLRDYEEKEHMTLCEESNHENENYHYIPHHPVVRFSSITTKLRVVFDASAKTTNGKSLNDMLLPGPNLQNDLQHILLRFRVHNYVITADIAQMFHQINVAKKDRHLQKILWRENSEDPIRVFSLNTVTYGTRSAPFLAMRCVREIGLQAEKMFPKAAAVIKEDFYMDDLLTGTDTFDEILQLQGEVSQLLESGKFSLRKWRSNDQRILQNLKYAGNTEEYLILDEQSSSKTLGLLWNSQSDILQFSINLTKRNTSSKREILSAIAQIHDPLGIIGPIIVKAKLIMQELWKLKIGWDQQVPKALQTIWDKFVQSLQHIEDIQVPRNVRTRMCTSKFSLHGFADASAKAYGACIYVVTIDHNNKYHSNLLCSKSRVAPLKTVSLPRLELCAALLLSRLISIVKTALKFQECEINLWSDSTVTLQWIQTDSSKLKTFVANRVTEIQDLTQLCKWRYVPSSENPADHISRGVTAEKLITLEQWWYGPHWLNSSESWPNQNLLNTDIPELKAVTSLAVQIECSLLHKFSSFGKLQRVVAYCYRYINNIRLKLKERDDIKEEKVKLRTCPLEIDELEFARTRILLWTQEESFSRELANLRSGKTIDSRSSLLSLNPFIDKDGLIRVGGRLKNADINYEWKHPIILPSKHHITRIILLEEHHRLLHCGQRQLLYSVRQKYWPFSGGREARKVVRACVPCFRYRPRMSEALMGDLPKERVNTPKFPFEITGVDYAGPVQLRESRRRGRIHISKAYIAVFVCFASKAIHLELVSDLSTETFLAALRRFIGRRGLCKVIYSDNAKNFVGAARELQELHKFLTEQEDKIKTSLTINDITWKFIPPRSPHFGGLWEAAVKSVKKHLYTVMKGHLYTFEELSTFLIRIESILNSRPLMPMSKDVNDYTMLTPAHFLIGAPLSEVTSGCFHDVPDNTLSRWQYLEKQRQQFWTRWKKDYLQQLQSRSKWSKGSNNIQIDTMVLIKEDNLPPLQWAVGRVIKCYSGADNITRVVDVRTPQGIYRRNITRLCVLPFKQNL